VPQSTNELGARQPWSPDRTLDHYFKLLSAVCCCLSIMLVRCQKTIWVFIYTLLSWLSCLFWVVVPVPTY